MNISSVKVQTDWVKVTESICDNQRDLNKFHDVDIITHLDRKSVDRTDTQYTLLGFINKEGTLFLYIISNDSRKMISVEECVKNFTTLHYYLSVTPDFGQKLRLVIRYTVSQVYEKYARSLESKKANDDVVTILGHTDK